MDSVTRRPEPAKSLISWCDDYLRGHHDKAMLATAPEGHRYCLEVKPEKELYGIIC
jgi:hypothetical protein